MEIEQLQQIFPTAECRLSPSEDEQYVSFPYNDQWIVLPKKDVSPRETQLLRLVTREQVSDKRTLENNHQWYRRLFLGEKNSGEEESLSLRIIQIKIVNHDLSIPAAKWLAAFSINV